MGTGIAFPPGAFGGRGGGGHVSEALEGTAVTELGTELGGRGCMVTDETELDGGGPMFAELGGCDGISSEGTGVIASGIG